jgi:hypothetical protein
MSIVMDSDRFDRRRPLLSPEERGAIRFLYVEELSSLNGKVYKSLVYEDLVKRASEEEMKDSVVVLFRLTFRGLWYAYTFERPLI